MKQFTTTAFLLLLFFGKPVSGQYHQFALQGKNELALSAAAGVSLVGGLYIKHIASPPSVADVRYLQQSEVNGFDRVVFQLPDKDRVLLSDIMVGGLAVLPASLLLHAESRHDFIPLAVIFIQTAAFTSGVTGLIKGTVTRYRPYVYNENVSLAARTSRDARQAFFSGHTSSAAALAFASASTLTAYVDSPVWDKVIWGVAITVPAYTGYLRMVSRKHFPTDVITGYAVGASIGLLIPHLHRVEDKNNNLTIDTQGSMFTLRYAF